MKRSVVLLVSVASVVLFAGTGFAQNETFDLKFAAQGDTTVQGAPGSVVEVPIDYSDNKRVLIDELAERVCLI